MKMRIAEAVKESPFLLGDLINWPAKLYPDKPAISWDGAYISYADLQNRVIERAAHLSGLGISRFQRWGLVYPNCAEFVVSLIALMRLGAVAVPLGIRYPAAKIRLLGERVRLAGILVANTPGGQERLSAAFSAWQPRNVDDHTLALQNPSSDPLAAVEPQRGIDLDPALILLTSGSTGASHGVVLQHHAILANLRANICELGYRDEDRTLVVLPMSHAYALIHQVLAHLLLGATVYLSSTPIVPQALWRRLDRERITTLSIAPPLVPVVVKALEGRKCLQDMRLLSIGAARTEPEHLAKLVPLLKKTSIALTYGLTEAGPRVSTHFVTGGKFNPRSIGAPLPNVEVRLSGAGDTASELLVRSRAISNRSAEEPFAEGQDNVLHTGDVARFSGGDLELEGRLRRTLNRGGFLIAPQDIEDTLRRHHEVGDAFVKGDLDGALGEVPVAFVSPRQGATIDIVELRRYCAAHLSPEERPVRFIVVDAIDRAGDKQKMLTSASLGLTLKTCFD
ncbi:MAG TPA: class I adenylate-forming enzyme family protein [Bryobacteraceae bacterium]|nr:class I adenylate-forming enzyme family protein [Bryobacteraceae bacterium]